MFLQYTPLRKIVGGAGQIKHDLSKFNYVPKENTAAHKSLSGKEEAILYNIEDFYDVKTQPIPHSDIDKWREWFASTAALEAFILDADDTATAINLVNPMNMKRVKNSYKESREGVYFVITFKAKRVY